METEVSLKELLEAGSHFGHQVSLWNPKMRPYIFSTKGGIHILDLEQTVVALRKACAFVTETVAQGDSVMFVGTKAQAKATIAAEAVRCNQYYVNNRWLGGLMTNHKTIQASINRLKELEARAASPDFEKYVKKERLEMEREIAKLNNLFIGIKTMPRLPGCLFIIDPKVETIAKKEANRLHIPIVAIVDTNCDPKGIDYLIPANDDAIRSIQVITKAVADACLTGAQIHQERIIKEGMKPEPVREAKGPRVEERKIGEKGKAFVGTKPGTKEEVIAEADLEKYASSRTESAKE